MENLKSYKTMTWREWFPFARKFKSIIYRISLDQVPQDKYRDSLEYKEGCDLLCELESLGYGYVGELTDYNDFNLLNRFEIMIETSLDKRRSKADKQLLESLIEFGLFSRNWEDLYSDEVEISFKISLPYSDILSRMVLDHLKNLNITNKDDISLCILLRDGCCHVNIENLYSEKEIEFSLAFCPGWCMYKKFNFLDKSKEIIDKYKINIDFERLKEKYYNI